MCMKNREMILEIKNSRMKSIVEKRYELLFNRNNFKINRVAQEKTDPITIAYCGNIAGYKNGLQKHDMNARENNRK